MQMSEAVKAMMIQKRTVPFTLPFYSQATVTSFSMSSFSYSSDDPLLEFDLYYDSTEPPPLLIVFVHGGAWRS